MFFSFDDLSDEEIEGDCCRMCGDTPCRWVHYRSEIIRRVGAVYGKYTVGISISNIERRVEVMRACRCDAFKCMCFLIHGSLGKGVRIKHSSCVEDGVREEWPPPGGKITGFMESLK